MKLADLYDLHQAGELGTSDPRWLDVQTQISAMVETFVRRKLRASGIYGETLDTAIEEVSAGILRKFIDRRFKPHTASITTILVASIKNELISHLRKNRSVTAASGPEWAESVWQSEPDETITEDRLDMFGRVRDNLAEYRFGHRPIREAILAYFLANEKFPGPDFLSTYGVGREQRQSWYNAAIVDLNIAMRKVCVAD